MLVNNPDQILINCRPSDETLDCKQIYLSNTCTIQNMKDYIAKEYNEYPFNIGIRFTADTKTVDLLTDPPMGKLPISSLPTGKDKIGKLDLIIVIESNRIKRVYNWIMSMFPW